MTADGLSRHLGAVRSQAENLRRSRGVIEDQLSGIDLGPWRGRRVALVGMGASYNAALACMPTMWASGIRASAWLGSDLELPGAVANIEAAIVISQTGRSAEMVSAVRSLPDGLPTLALTDDPRSPLATESQMTIALGLLADSEVRTLGYTGTLQALGILTEALAPDARPADWAALADEVNRQIPRIEGLTERLLEAMSGLVNFELVGSGASFGTAAQGALLLREVSRLAASAYETRNYLHGPIEAVDDTTAFILFGGTREARLAESMAAVGASVLLVTFHEVSERPRLNVLRLSPASEAARPVLEILPLQTLSGSLARARGVPVGEFRHHQDDTKVA